MAKDRKWTWKRGKKESSSQLKQQKFN